MTRNNLIYLVVGALCVGVAVLGYQLYQERQKPGLSHQHRRQGRAEDRGQMNSGDGWALRSAAAIVLGLALTAAGAAAAQTVMKSEPPGGALKRGTTILVDDGSCPAGQIKEVTAGRGQGQGSTPRTRRCVAKR